MFFTIRSFLGFLAVLGLIYWHYLEGKYMYAILWYFLGFKALLKNPSLLHPIRNKFKMIPKKPNYTHWLIAHRGGSAEAPENTLQAFKKSIENATS